MNKLTDILGDLVTITFGACLISLMVVSTVKIILWMFL